MHVSSYFSKKPGLSYDHGDSNLHTWCRRSDLNAFKNYYNTQKNSFLQLMNQPNTQGDKPLKIAIQYKAYDCFKLLLDAGADVQECDSEKNSALHFSVRSQDSKFTKLLLERNDIDLEAKNKSCNTPLFEALRAQALNLEAIEMLLKAGAKTENCTEDDWTILHVALKIGNLELIKLVLEHGNPIIANCYHYEHSFTHKGTPFHVAIDARNKEAFSELINYASKKQPEAFEIEDPNHQMPNVLMYAIEKNLPDYVWSLIEAGCEVKNTEYNLWKSAYSVEKLTPLMFAAKNGSRELLEILVKGGGDLHFVLNDKNVLDYAAENNQLGVVEFLLENNVNPNLRNPDVLPPLYKAISSLCFENIKQLLQHGASVRFKNCRNETPFDVFIDKIYDKRHPNDKVLEIIQLFIEKGAPISTDIEPRLNGYLNSYKRLDLLELRNKLKKEETNRMIKETFESCIIN